LKAKIAELKVTVDLANSDMTPCHYKFSAYCATNATPPTIPFPPGFTLVHSFALFSTARLPVCLVFSNDFAEATNYGRGGWSQGHDVLHLPGKGKVVHCQTHQVPTIAQFLREGCQ